MKRVLLDTCVIYPTVMREMLLAVAVGQFVNGKPDASRQNVRRFTLRAGTTGEVRTREVELALPLSPQPES